MLEVVAPVLQRYETTGSVKSSATGRLHTALALAGLTSGPSLRQEAEAKEKLEKTVEPRTAQANWAWTTFVAGAGYRVVLGDDIDRARRGGIVLRPNTGFVYTQARARDIL